MDLPSFDEFKSSITPERYMEICHKLDRIEIFQFADGLTPENIGAFCERLMYVTLKSAAVYQLSLLEEYHEWLRENLDR